MKYLNLLVLLVIFSAHTSSGQAWKVYPYSEAGTLLSFPADEGAHPVETTEWWYTVAHVTGDITGNEYSYMLTYFAYDTTLGGLTFDGFRIFNLANETTGEFFPETLPVTYDTLAETHLQINAVSGFVTNESWETKKDTLGNLVPFEYHIEATSASGALSIDYAAMKRPLIVGDTGFFYQGINDYTYYYSQTALDVSGSLTIDGFTETVTGLAWIDRQWGNFNPSSGEKYEWFCMQLDNGMDFNIWNIFNAANEMPDTSTYTMCSIYHDSVTSSSNSSFKLERLKYVFTSDTVQCYSQQWRYTYQDIDLLMTTIHENTEVQMPFRFYEGSIDVSGTVGGVPVTGVGFAELLHSYSHPNLQIDGPSVGGEWDGTQSVSWTVLDKDEGRPLSFDLAYSTDGITYTDIATGITDMNYAWDLAGLWETECWLRLKGYSIDNTLSSELKMSSSFTVGPVTGVENISSGKLGVAVTPNPFSDLVQIQVRSGDVNFENLEILNSLGQIVQTVSATNKGAYSWNGKNSNGEQVPSGVYYYRLKTANGIANGKMMYLK